MRAGGWPSAPLSASACFQSTPWACSPSALSPVLCSLPPIAISGINSFYARGYGDPPPETLIVLGHSADFLRANFTSCRVAAHSWNRYEVENEETSDNPDIYVCRGLKKSWPEFWSTYRHFG